VEYKHVFFAFWIDTALILLQMERVSATRVGQATAGARVTHAHVGNHGGDEVDGWTAQRSTDEGRANTHTSHAHSGQQ
jgi:hypothetical protein